eukprot:6646358-Pyramimonas_sp.AAC.1
MFDSLSISADAFANGAYLVNAASARFGISLLDLEDTRENGCDNLELRGPKTWLRRGSDGNWQQRSLRLADWLARDLGPESARATLFGRRPLACRT